MNLRPYIEKLQGLPESTKKIILWTIVAILAVVMGYFWVRGAINTFPKTANSIIPPIQINK